MKNKTMKYIAIGIGILALLVSLNGLFNGNWILGIGGILVCLFLIVWGFKITPEVDKLSMYEVMEGYKVYLEKYFRISLPRDVEVYHFDENDTNYLFVLAYLDRESNEKIYFPFEADKFKGDFGRGTGQFLTEIREVEFWINKYDKTYRASDEIARRMSDKISSKIKEELDYYYYGQGGDEDGTRTTGG